MQFHEQAVTRTLSRTGEIAQKKDEILRAAIVRSNPSAINFQELPPHEPYTPIVDSDLERLLQLRKEEKARRQEQSALKLAHSRANCERSARLLQEELARREGKLKSENDRFERWKQSRHEKDEQQMERYRSRSAHEEAVVALGLRSEEDRRRTKLLRISAAEDRSKSVVDRVNSEMRGKLATMRAKLSARVQKAHDQQARLEQRRNEHRTAIEDEVLQFSKRWQEKMHELSLKMLDRQLDRDEKVDKVRRIPIARQYAMDLDLRKRYEDTVTEQQLAAERTKLTNQKALEQSRYLERKERLLDEIAQMRDPNDPKYIKRIQAILQVTDDEMEELITMAKAPLARASRPATASGSP
jgi:hypothetical protein